MSTKDDDLEAVRVLIEALKNFDPADQRVKATGVRFELFAACRVSGHRGTLLVH